MLEFLVKETLAESEILVMVPLVPAVVEVVLEHLEEEQQMQMLVELVVMDFNHL